MSWTKPVLSIFLLLIYSVGIADNSIPHCHIGDFIDHFHQYENSDSHHLENHKHSENKDLDDDDIKHENHLDDSFFDFVICLLSESDHPAHEYHQHYFPIRDFEFGLKLVNHRFPVILLLDDLADIGSNKPVRLYYFDSDIKDQIFIVEFSPLRGPPALTC